MDISNSRTPTQTVRADCLNSTGLLLKAALRGILRPAGRGTSWEKSWQKSRQTRWQKFWQKALFAMAFCLISGVLCANPYTTTAKPDSKAVPPQETGIFLVATEQLDNTAFAQTVILITHNSEKGAAGLAINRPSQYRLNELFQQQPELRRHQDEVFLGGPVQSDSIFVLMRTKRAHAGMYQVAKDLYFAAGLDALTHGLKNLGDRELVRAYVGFSGWAPGQLDEEIQRGDWLVVHANTDIIFDQDNGSVWQRMYKTWTGQWI